MDAAGASMYLNREEFKRIRPGQQALWDIHRYFEAHVAAVEDLFEIQVDGINVEDPAKSVAEPEEDTEERRTKFINRAICTGNYSQLFILPDGNVTICEELYWHEHFILGNIREQSLAEIWNSEKATDLYAFPQYKIPAESPCSTCSDYYLCRDTKQVCWKNIVKAFGDENWYYPDTNCPKAPAPTYAIK